LSYDLWYIFLGLFIICIVESGQIEDTNNYVFPFPDTINDSGLIYLISFLKLSAHTLASDYQLYYIHPTLLTAGIPDGERIFRFAIPRVEQTRHRCLDGTGSPFHA
jgi:hypothetical protein